MSVQPGELAKGATTRVQYTIRRQEDIHSSWKVGAAATGSSPSQVLSRPSCPSSRFADRELGRQVARQLMAIGAIRAFGKRGRQSIDLSVVPLPGEQVGSLGTCGCRREL